MIIPSFKALITFIRAVVSGGGGGGGGGSLPSEPRKLYAWGRNSLGQLGLSDTTDRTSPVQVGSETNWKMVSSGYATALAVKTDGTLWAWGFNTAILNQSLGTSSPIQIGTSTDWETVSVGALTVTEEHALAIKTNGTLWAWGLNGNGQLGLGNTTSTSSPVQIGTLTNWLSVSAGGASSFAIKRDGTLWAWGRNTSGVLGLGDTTNRSSPVQIGTGTDWRKVSIGRGIFYVNSGSVRALKKSGTLWSWGENADGQLGLGDTTTRSSPVQIGANTDWADIGQTYQTGLAVKTNGTLWTWGSGYGYKLGQGYDGGVNKSSPVQVGANTDWLIPVGQVGRTLQLAIKTNGSLWSGGYSSIFGIPFSVYFAQFGSRTDWNFSTSSCYPEKIHAIIGDFEEGGKLFAWGSNVNGRLGLGNLFSVSSPVQIGTDTDWKIFSSSSHTLAVKTNGTLWSWGSNIQGQLGNGNTTSRSSPVQVGTDIDWDIVSASDSSAAIKKNGTLWTWGTNNLGELGHGNTTNRSSPVQVGTGTDWAFVKMGASSTFAIKKNGTLWAWGSNYKGKLGLGDTVSRSSPVQVGAGTDWAFVTTAFSHTLAIKTNGTLWAWGSNYTGQLGLGDTTDRSSPVQVGTGTSWAKVSTDGAVLYVSYNYYRPGGQCLALKTDGTLWSWGLNNAGQLGHGDTTNRSSPVQVGTNANWNSIAAGYYSSFAGNTDEKLFSWGLNNIGQLGHGDQTNRSSPVQIGTEIDWQQRSKISDPRIAYCCFAIRSP